MNIDLQHIINAIVGGVAAMIGYQIKTISKKAHESLNRDEVIEVINDKIKPLELRLEELKGDCERIETKLDKLIDKLL